MILASFQDANCQIVRKTVVSLRSTDRLFACVLPGHKKCKKGPNSPFGVMEFRAEHHFGVDHFTRQSYHSGPSRQIKFPSRQLVPKLINRGNCADCRGVDDTRRADFGQRADHAGAL